MNCGNKFNLSFVIALGMISISVSALAADDKLGRPDSEKTTAMPLDFLDDNGGCPLSAFKATGALALIDGAVHGAIYMDERSRLNAVSESEATRYIDGIVRKMQKNPFSANRLDQLVGGNDSKMVTLKVNEALTSAKIAKQEAGLANLDDQLEFLRGFQREINIVEVHSQGFTALSMSYPIADTYEALGTRLREVLQQQRDLSQKYPIDEIESQMAQQAVDHQQWQALKETGSRRALTLEETTQLNSLAGAEAKFERLKGQQTLYRDGMRPLLEEESVVSKGLEVIAKNDPAIVDAFTKALNRSDTGKDLLAGLKAEQTYQAEQSAWELDRIRPQAEANAQAAMTSDLGLYDGGVFLHSKTTDEAWVTEFLRGTRKFSSMAKCAAHGMLAIGVGHDVLSLAIDQDKKAEQNRQAATLDDAGSVFSNPNPHTSDSPSTQPK